MTDTTLRADLMTFLVEGARNGGRVVLRTADWRPMCAWPLVEVRDRVFELCGADREDGEAYCAECREEYEEYRKNPASGECGFHDGVDQILWAHRFLKRQSKRMAA